MPFRYLALIPVLCAALIAGASASGQSCGLEYSFQEPGYFDAVTAVLYREPYFYGVSVRSVVVSLDGRQWRQVAALSSDTVLADLCWGRGTFVAVGSNGVVATSSDGLVWDERSLGQDEYLSSVAAGPGGFVAVGYYHNIYWSADGVQWTATPSPSPTNMMLAVAWGNGVFVAAGYGGTILTSSDGRQWSVGQSAQEDEWQAIAFTGTQFIVAGWRGGIETSPDGITWTERYTDSMMSFYGVGSSRKMLVVTGYGGEIVVSADGSNWQDRSTGRWAYLRDVAFGGGLYAIAGDEFLTSGDALDWEPASVSSCWYGAAYGNGRFVAAGRYPAGFPLASVAVQEDGSNWKQTFFDGDRPGFRGVCFGAGTFVAAGTEAGAALLMTSPDGYVWTRQDGGNLGPMTAVAYGSGRFVAVGNGGAIYSSADSVHWAEEPSPVTDDLAFVIFGGGRFLAGGASGAFLESPDGTAWSAVPLSLRNDLTCAAYGGGTYVMGSVGGIWTSSDGLAWSRQSCICAADYLISIVYEFSRFLGTDQHGAIYTSSDGLTWQWVAELPWYVSERALVYGGGRYLLAGDGLLGTSDCDLAASISAGPLHGAAPQDVRLEAIARGGSPPYSYAWDFGDGTQGDGEAVTHTYTRRGSCDVHLVVTDSESGRQDAKPVTVELPAVRPTIAKVRVLSGPTRLKVSGTGFHRKCAVTISGCDAPQTAWRSSKSVLAKGGSRLKALLPKGTPVQITVVNLDDGGQSEPITLTP